MNRKKKKILAILLAISMVIPNVATANADIGTPGDAEYVTEQTDIQITDDVPNEEVVEEDTSADVTEEETPEEMEKITEDITEEVTEEVTTEENSTEEITTQKTTTEEVTTEDITTEEVTEEKKQPTFTSPVEGVDVSGIDFSSRQLLVGTEDESIFTWDTTVVSGYNGIYLTEYASEEETKNAYTYYYGKADFVDANITFTVSDDEESKESPKDTSDLSEINTGDDAISNLNDMDTAGTVPEGTIAVIDTGINGEGLVDSVSVIGDSVSDDNGHGTRMYDFIKAEYPNAKVISIKALGSDGKGQVSDVYAAIQYAIEKRVSVINLSISAYSTAESDVIRNVIEDAVAQGIVVVGAAGNDGKNVKYFIPGNIDSAVIVGASDGNGQKIAGSNYGSTVDYNVEADSTSEAAAKMSAIIAKNDGTNSAKIFTTDYSEEEETGEQITYENSEFVIATNDPDIDNYNGGASGNQNYVKNNGRPGDGDLVVFKYYDKDGNYIKGGVDTRLTANGSANQQTNTICVRTDYSPGNQGWEFDVIEQSINDTKFKNLLYYAITKLNYNDAHNMICYYGYTKQTVSGINLRNGNSNASAFGSRTINVSGFNGTYDSFIDTYSNTAIPSNYVFDVYYLAHDTTYESPTYGAFQDFISWKLTEKNDYYIAIKKVDSRGYEMNGVTFSVSYHDNDTNTDVTIPGGYINSKYSHPTMAWNRSWCNRLLARCGMIFL